MAAALRMPRLPPLATIGKSLNQTHTRVMSSPVEANASASEPQANKYQGPKIVPPEGMSKRAYKRQLKAERIEKERPKWLAERKQKRKDIKEQRKAAGTLKQSNRKRVPANQQMTSMGVIVDCDFDDYMKEGERTSLARQIMSCYSENRKALYQVDLRVTSFNKQLAQRFTGNMQNTHLNWKNIRFEEQDFEPSENIVYLSSDSDTVLETLEQNTTYVIGGIVDKGRYKDLCKNKAEKLGLRTARLPIDEYIKLSGRRVLTTNHVFELLVRWLEVRSWKEAFEAVLPDRKMRENKELEQKSDENKTQELESQELESEN